METFTTTHWGSYRVEVEQGRLVGVHPVAWDRDPSPIGQSLPDTVHGPSRVRRPAVRAGFLEKGAASREGRGSEPFVEVSWDEALDLVARELKRVTPRARQRGDLRRLVRLVERGALPPRAEPGAPLPERARRLRAPRDTYSLGAGRTLLPHVIARASTSCARSRPRGRRWTSTASSFVAFGGVPREERRRSTPAAAPARHAVPACCRAARARASPSSTSSPVRDDLDEVPGRGVDSDPAEHATPRSCSRSRTCWSRRTCTTARFSRPTARGFERFRRLRARARRDGMAKSPDWAAAIADVRRRSGSAARAAHGRRAARSSTSSWSLQRADHGEQPFWMVVTLAAHARADRHARRRLRPRLRLGQRRRLVRPSPFSGPVLPQGTNAVESLHPGRAHLRHAAEPGAPLTTTTAQSHVYPDIRLVYWAAAIPSTTTRT